MSTPSQRRPGDAPDIADASSLFADDRPASRTDRPKAPAVAPGETFDLAGGEPEDLGEAAPPIPIPAPPRPAKKAPKAPKPAEDEVEEARVDEVWSRWAESGADYLRLLAVAVATMVLAYFVSGLSLGLAFLVVLLGGAAFVLLSYPVVITLERPVRVTPQQAAADYFAALSHHYPHYRRMWLLLSESGRESRSFDSFDGFRSYWKGQLERLKKDLPSKFTPLDFKVEDFKSDKSVGRTAIDAKFTVSVSVRGQQGEGPIETYRFDTTLAKGPDNMWYLNRGTLPNGRE